MRRESLAAHPKPQPLRADSFGKDDSPHLHPSAPARGRSVPGGGRGERGMQRGAVGSVAGGDGGVGKRDRFCLPRDPPGPDRGSPPTARGAGPSKTGWFRDTGTLGSGGTGGFCWPSPSGSSAGSRAGVAVGQSQRARSGAVTYCCCGETERETLKQGEQIRNPTLPSGTCTARESKPRAIPTQIGKKA